MLDFAKQYPGIVVYVKPRRHRSPCIAAEYCMYISSILLTLTRLHISLYISVNGDKETISCHNITREEILKWLNLLRTQSGNSKDFRLRKLWHTDSPSIQGPWTPFTFRDPKTNLAEFPNKELSKPVFLPKSATEELVELFQQQQISSADKTEPTK